MTEITITIKNRNNSSQKRRAPESSNSGLVLGSRGQKKNGRRRLQKSSPIWFYDGALYLSEGEFIEDDFTVDTGFDGYFLNNPTQDEINTFNARINRTEDFENFYKRIEPGARGNYRILISSDAGTVDLTEEDPWTTNGISIPNDILQGTNFRVSQSSLPPIGGVTDEGLIFNSIKLTGEGKNKITTVFDADAETVSFQPRLGGSFFLVPPIILSFAHARYDNGVPVNEDVFSLFRFHPRSIFLDSGDPLYGNFFARQTGSNYTDSENYERIWRMGEVIKNMNEAKMSKQVFLTVSHPDPSTFPDEAFFPEPPGEPDDAAFNEFRAGYTDFSKFAADYGFKVLLAVIRQGAQTFYVWS